MVLMNKSWQGRELIVKLENMPLERFKKPIPDLTVCLDTESSSDEEDNTYFIEETNTEVNFSLKKNPSIAKSRTVKNELGDFQKRKTKNVVDRELDQKSTIKSEEYDFINNQYVISHEEVDIKSEDDEEQSDIQFKNHKVRHTPKDQIKIHKCPDCPYQSKRKSDLKKHSTLHRKPEEILWHQLKHKSTDKRHTCFKCPYKTHLKSSLSRHALTHSVNNVKWLRCMYCSFKSLQKSDFKRHQMSHQDHDVPIDWVQFPERPHTTVHKDNLKQQALKTGQCEIFKCAHCDYESPKKRNLKLHVRVHSNGKFFKCAQCPYQAKRQDFMKVHQLVHKTSNKLHACSQCPYITIRKFDLRDHVVRKHPNPDQIEWYMCEQCPYKTNKKCQFNKHALAHKMRNAKWLQCTYCSFKSVNKSDFRLHKMRYHHADDLDLHKCPECPYKTFFKYHLQRHAENHKAADQIDWLQCPECSFRTCSPANLKMHQMLHNDVVEWFRCFDCAYKTTLKRSLVSHVKLHR